MASTEFELNQSIVAHLPHLAHLNGAAIISKALIESKCLRQVLFALDVDQSISEHQTPYTATVLVLEGNLDFVLDGKPHQLAQNDFVLMAPNVRHSLRASTPSRFLLTLIHQEDRSRVVTADQ